MFRRTGFFVFLAAVSLFMASYLFAQSSRANREAEIEAEPLTEKLPRGVKVRAFIHRPRVVEPNHLGECTSDDSDPTGFGSTGWHLSGPITWRLNSTTVPASIGNAASRIIQEAFNTWGPNIFAQGEDAPRVKAAKFDGVNVIMWKRLSASTIGVTYVWYYTSSGDVAEVDTIFNNRYSWADFDDEPDCQNAPEDPDAYDLQNIAVHEFGHWIGLDDLYGDGDKDLTMFGFGAGGEVKKRTLEQGDIDGKNSLLRSQ